MIRLRAMSEPDNPQLDYAPAPLFATPRRALRRAAVWLALGACVIAAVTWGPSIWDQAWYLRAERRCLAFQLPAGQIAYANQAEDATPLLAAGYQSVASVTGPVAGATPSATMSAGYVFAPLAEVGEDTLAYYSRIGTGFQRQGSGGPTRTGAFARPPKCHFRPEAGGNRLSGETEFCGRGAGPGGQRASSGGRRQSSRARGCNWGD